MLNRLPAPARRTPRAVARLLASSFPGTRFLGARTAAWLLGELQRHGIAGGAVYDALVGAAAKEHGLPLVTRDRDALDVYRGFDVDVQMLG